MSEAEAGIIIIMIAILVTGIAIASIKVFCEGE